MLPTGSTRYVRRGPASATASSRGRRCAWHHRGRRVGHGFPAAASPRGGAPAERERSELVAEETVYLMFQLDLDVQLQRSLNINAFDRAQEIRNRRQKLDETIAEMTERKALKMGAPGSLATLSFSDFASEGLRLRSDMQRAVEDERYEDAAKVKTLLAELEMESKRAQAEAEEWRSVQPKLRLGQRVMHRTGGYRGLVVGYDLQCCETNEWVMGVQLKGKEQQPFYHILVDERDWELEVETGMPPVAYGATFVQVEIVATGCSSSAFLGGSVGKTGARGTRDTFMVVVLPFPFLVFPLPLPVFSCLLSPCVIQSCFPPPSFLALPPSCLFFYCNFGPPSCPCGSFSFHFCEQTAQTS
uniref:Hemimethylated DNA-binding domain-containing protein n=1 Tax=Chlamydomonas euryale TaxID=1486919 RepID=A0A7R9VCC7_9CHLO|mmetsp:Transcript_29976/g.88928  ORF Transcript_29976/g.88928 Transcript_29976/m.88928 type:complete len:358 (+) Transcript_29976:117-1190(+)